MNSFITEELFRRVRARLTRIIHRKAKSMERFTRDRNTTRLTSHCDTSHNTILYDTILYDTADFAFVGNHEPEFITD